MPNLTVSITEELRKKMKRHPEMRWSEVVRQSITQRIEELEMVERIARKSKLTSEDVRRIAGKVDKAVALRLGLHEDRG